ncbi:uncharacterized protein LOC111700980 [Eurytemora carolleeae]|uniref:uncharacterized protein LOC111700980 n=1 Tax=Eurytemora carolleeae TaxID=1294199 RepID=UPI000C78FA24|nr:uncharacterized protein LOC111700980 [Eurytemora carolleeae]|eukprot:XP_023327846.1 uncharacterized protein LOC111700980 [Eurytemora affinis]
MRFPESLKNILKTVTVQREDKHSPIIRNDDPDVHYTPPGQYPASGPKPSKVGVLFYYMSLCLCIVGLLFLTKTTYVYDEDKPDILMMSSILIAVGFFFLGISNTIENRERRKLISYLEGKIEELMSQNRNPRPLDS